MKRSLKMLKSNTEGLVLYTSKLNKEGFLSCNPIEISYKVKPNVELRGLEIKPSTNSTDAYQVRWYGDASSFMEMKSDGKDIAQHISLEILLDVPKNYTDYGGYLEHGDTLDSLQINDVHIGVDLPYMTDEDLEQKSYEKCLLNYGLFAHWFKTFMSNDDLDTYIAFEEKLTDIVYYSIFEQVYFAVGE